jgi:hypothetical protein
MTLPRTVADVLDSHVVFEVECIDRMYLNVYVPKLQRELGLIGYLRDQLGCPVASTAPLGELTDAFATNIRRFARQGGIPIVNFVKSQRKDEVMAVHLARFPAAEGVVFIGRAQEKTRVFRTEKRRDAAGRSYPWIVRTTAVINQWYCYCLDADFGPFFPKFSGYFPCNAKLCVNGHHWAQRQAATAGIGFTALDNGFAAVDDVAGLQRICDSLAPEQIDALAQVTDPVTTDTGTRVAGLRFTDPRAQALLATLCVFRLLPAGFTNADLRRHLAPMLGTTPEHMTSGQMTGTCDGYACTDPSNASRTPSATASPDTGLRSAMFLTRVHSRLLRTGLAELSDPTPPPDQPGPHSQHDP